MLSEQLSLRLDDLLLGGTTTGEIEKLIEYAIPYIKSNKLSKAEISELNSNFGAEFLKNTIQGYGIRKPYGYAGDFLMIDKIYTYHKSDNPTYRVWDEFFHLQEAPRAVRNRKSYFKQIVEGKSSVNSNLKLLNVASGPARDLYELYKELPEGKTVSTTCIEMDENAIAYAKNLNKEFSDEIDFVHKNIFKHRDIAQYDLIWSAGLFDYFNDKAFLLVLKKFKDWLNPEGEIVIGNFNQEHNPSRDYMEIFGEWYLHHRTADQLMGLALAAGFKEEQVRIGREPENVNLFLHISGSY